MTNNKRYATLLILSGLFYLVTYEVVSHIALSSFSTLQIQYDSDRADRFFAYYSPGTWSHFSHKHLVKTDIIPAGKGRIAKMNLRDHVARKLRLDPGSKPGWVRLRHITLTSHFGPPVTMNADEIFQRFRPNGDISRYRLHMNAVELTITGGDPQLVLNDDLMVRNHFISIVLPFVFTLAFYLIASHFQSSSFPAFYDLAHHKSSANINYASLDGVRGIAVLLVLLDHSWGFFTGAGTAGVWIFFVLSGFLLAIPFVRKPELAKSGEYMNEYLLRRLKRILPMYYFFIVIKYFLYGKYDSTAIRHLLFLQGDGHLWTIPQEMLFYLFLPFIMLINYAVFRGRPIWIVMALAVFMVLTNIFLDKSVISLYSANTTRPAFVGIFICGIMFSYLYHGLLSGRDIPFLRTDTFRLVATITGITLLVIFFILPTDALFSRHVFQAIRHPGWFGIGAGIMIVLVLLARGTLYDRILSWTPLRALGLVGFSFYLLHPIVITLVKGMQDYYLGYRIGVVPQLLVILLLTYVLAAFTYSYIEHPFLKRAKKQKLHA